jgi:cell division protein FtsQ
MQSIKKHIKKIALLLLIPIMAGLFMAANIFEKNNACAGVFVKILNKASTNFISEKDIATQVVSNYNIKKAITPLKAININAIETALNNNPWINNANVYFDNKEVLHIDIEQAIPVVRWINANEVQTYLDKNAKPIPLNDANSVDVPIATTSLLDVSIKDQDVLKQLVKVATTIAADSFWNAAITQIDYTPENNFVLFTNLGKHTIQLGDTSNLVNKLSRLYLFYKEALPRVGWDVYSTIKLQYNGQLVAVKENIDNIATTPNKDANSAITLNANKVANNNNSKVLNTKQANAKVVANNNTNPKPKLIPKPTTSKANKAVNNNSKTNQNKIN